jgi:hypothetical protein
VCGWTSTSARSKPAESQADAGPWTGNAHKAWTQIRRASEFWTATILDDFGVGIVDSSRAGDTVNGSTLRAP